MHNIQLNVTNQAYEHLIYFLKNLKNDVEIVGDRLISFGTDEDIENELLVREKELKEGKAKLLSKEEVFGDI